MEIDRYTTISFSNYFSLLNYNIRRGITGNENMGRSTLKIGTNYEREVEEKYKSKGFRTHRNIKSRYGKQDLLGISDIVATKNDTFLLIACAVGRAQTKTVKKILEIRPWIPPFVKIKYYIKKKDGTEEERSF